MSYGVEFRREVNNVLKEYGQDAVQITVPKNTLTFSKHDGIFGLTFDTEDIGPYPSGLIGLYSYGRQKNEIVREVVFGVDLRTNLLNLYTAINERTHKVLKEDEMLNAALNIARDPVKSKQARFLLGYLTDEDKAAKDRWLSAQQSIDDSVEAQRQSRELGARLAMRHFGPRRRQIPYLPRPRN
jgi:hypothetical protein